MSESQNAFPNLFKKERKKLISYKTDQIRTVLSFSAYDIIQPKAPFQNFLGKGKVFFEGGRSNFFLNL